MGETEKELLALMDEYWLASVPKNPEYQNPFNMNQLDFYGFYEWLKSRKAIEERRLNPPSKSEEINI